MNALQQVFRAVDETQHGTPEVDDNPPWEDPPAAKKPAAPPAPPAAPPAPPPAAPPAPAPKPLPPRNHNLSDAEGLQKAYASPDNIYVDGNRMYVAGTTPSPLGDSLASTVRNTENFIQDWTENFQKLPFGLTKATKRYQQAYNALQKNPQVDTLIGHSLGGAVVNEMGVSEPTKYKTRSYSAPVFRSDLPNDENHQRYRTEGDIVAIMDRWANTVKKDTWNPISLHAYSNFGDIGKRPTPGSMPVRWVM